MMVNVLVRPLNAKSRMQSRWIDGRPMSEVAEEFIKPNEQLTAFQRLEIYNRQYWFRLLECFSEDNPGLRAVLGERKFMRLAEAYLAKFPSRSFTLRNLCSRLETFVAKEPKRTAPHTKLACDLVKFEWAQIVAFDGPTKPTLSASEIAEANPSRLRLGLQPYLSLLVLNYPVDDFIVAVKKQGALRSEASNAVENAPKAPKVRRVSLPKPERVYVAVHRVDNMLYYKRLELGAFKILSALAEGATVVRACSGALPKKSSAQAAFAGEVQLWFKTWIELGWLCRRE